MGTPKEGWGQATVAEPLRLVLAMPAGTRFVFFNLGRDRRLAFPQPAVGARVMQADSNPALVPNTHLPIHLTPTNLTQLHHSQRHASKQE